MLNDYEEQMYRLVAAQDQNVAARLMSERCAVQDKGYYLNIVDYTSKFLDEETKKLSELSGVGYWQIRAEVAKRLSNA